MGKDKNLAYDHFGDMVERKNTPRRVVTHYLREHRTARGMTLADVARAINEFDPEAKERETTISRFESGARGLSPLKQQQFAGAFGISVAELFEPPSVDAERKGRRSIDALLRGQPDYVWDQVERVVHALLVKTDPD